MATLPQRPGASMEFMEFMKSQPLGNNMSPIAGLSSSSSCFNSSTDCSEARNMRRMIDELERTRSRYESEQSNTVSFGKQMDMLSKQMCSLTEQQQSLLGYHIVRINSMIDDLRKSTDNMARHEREKFEQHAREEHERIQREARERFERDCREREERECRERGERERREKEERERREKEERERKEREENDRQEQEAKLREEFLNSPKVDIPPPTATSLSPATSTTLPMPEDLDMSALPDMDLGDVKSFPELMELLKRQQQQAVNNASQVDSANALALDVSIPPPSRTVTPTSQKRRRSLTEAKSGTKIDSNESSDACGSRLSFPMHKKAKVAPSTNESGVQVMNRNRLVAEPSSMENTYIKPESTTSMVDDDEAAVAIPIGDTPIEDCLPAELQAQLQAQALAMLQAQMEQNEAETLASVAAMDTSPDDAGNPIAPPKELTPVRAKPAGPASNSNAPVPFINPIKAEPEMSKPYPVIKPEPQSSSSSSSAAAPKLSVEKPKKKKKAPAKKSGGATKSEPVQAVEDTTIANPESVPLKNKAIHQWMAEDPERLYTADDIVNAGIRYRAQSTRGRCEQGKIYVISGNKEVRNALARKSNVCLWRFIKGEGWKVILD